MTVLEVNKTNDYITYIFTMAPLKTYSIFARVKANL